MPYAIKAFRRTKTYSGKRYQSRPTGLPDVSRLIRGLPYWVNPLPPKEEKNKTLILADWTAAGWSRKKIGEVMQALSILMTPGKNGLAEAFDIYIWQQGTLLKLTKENLSCLLKQDVRNQMRPTSLDAVSADAQKQLKLARDDVHVLDDYWLTHLLSGDDTPKPRAIHLSDFSATINVYDRSDDAIVKLIDQAKPVVTQIIIDIFKPDAVYHLELLRKAFPSCQLVKKCAHLNSSHIASLHSGESVSCPPDLVFSPSELSILDELHLSSHTGDKSDIGDHLQYILSLTKNLTKLTWVGIDKTPCTMDLPQNSLPNLKEVKLSDITSTTIVQVLLKAAPNLKTIDLIGCQALTGDLTFAPKSLLQLETANLGRSTLSLKNLQVLLEAAPNLKTIDLSYCQALRGDLTLAPNSLLQLETANLSGSNLSLKSLKVLLEAAPNLKAINLYSCQELTGDLTIAPNSLLQLETVYLIGSTLSLKNLQVLLKAAPSLKKINLNGCPALTGDLTLTPNSLRQLEKVNLTGSNLSLKNLQVLLEAAPSLKKINLNGCPALTGDLTLTPNSLRQLEKVNLTGSNLSLKNLQVLLEAAPNLKTIDLSYCRELTGDLTLDPQSLRQLETVYLIGSTLSLKNLQVLLEAAPSLKTIDLSDSQALTDTLTLAPKSLLQLETVNLSGSTLSLKNLQVLLKAAPSLKTIDLSDSQALTDTLTLAPKSLLQLETVNLSGSNLSLKNLQVLLKAAPNLKTINLEGCNALVGELLLDANSLPKLKNVKISGSNLSLNNLNVLLKAAPEIAYPHWIIADCEKNATTRATPSLGGWRAGFNIGAGTSAGAGAGAGAGARISAGAETNAGAGAGVRTSAGAETSAGTKAPLRRGASGNKTESLDADTRYNPGKTFKVTELFRPIGPHTTAETMHYRLDVFQKVSVTTSSCPISDAFTLSQEGELDLTPVTLKQSAEEMDVLPGIDGFFFYGQQTITLSRAWQALPSLSPQETLHRYHTSPDASVEIQYSKRDNLYYIRSMDSDEQTITIDFTISTPKTKPAALPSDIQSIVDEFKAFGIGELTLDKSKSYTGAEYLDTLMTQKKGACRHRTLAFKLKMAETYPHIPVRIVNNDCHSFVEVRVDDHWHTCDLGGYPAGLDITPLTKPSETPKPLIHTHLHYDEPAGAGAGAGSNTSTSSTAPTTVVAEPPKPAALTASPADDAAAAPGVSKTPATPVISTPTDMPVITLDALRPKTPPLSELKAYCQRAITPSDIKKRLIECRSSSEVDSLSIALQGYSDSVHRPIFYVNSPDDLCCAAPFMHASGELRKGPGGPLYDFLTKNPTGVLLINYEHFEAEDIVRFNTLLDKERLVDGVPLPPAMTVMGLINLNHPDCYQGADFYSRFDATEKFSLPDEQWQAILPPLPELLQAPPSDEDAYTISLFKAADWPEKLLGHWTFGVNADGQSTLVFQEGALQKALRSGKTTINLDNAPWDNKAFVYFWQSALRLGYIEHQGRYIDLPDGFTLTRYEGYDFRALLPQVTLTATPSTLPLNPSTFNSFFTQFTIDEHQQFIPTEGHIEKAKGTTLAVYLTRELDEHAWAMLLTTCQTYGVKLALKLAPGVKPPTATLTPPETRSDEESAGARAGAGAGASTIASATGGTAALTLPLPALFSAATPPWDKRSPATKTTTMIQSTDADTTAALLIKESSDWIVIDATELHDTDLLKRLHGELHQDTLRFEFSNEVCALLHLLKNNKRVILKGHFSSELADELAAFILERQTSENPTGTLVIIDEAAAFGYAHPSLHEVTPDEKIACLLASTSTTHDAAAPDDSAATAATPAAASIPTTATPSEAPLTPEALLTLLTPYLDEPLSKLQCRLDWLKAHAPTTAAIDTSTSDEAWVGLREGKKDLKPLAPFNPDSSEAEAKAFMTERLTTVNTLLAQKPYVFLSGLSGVGKTTFVQRFLSKSNAGDVLFSGEDALKDWASDTSVGRKLLFIDEATLKPSEWRLFEGLFATPPGILIEGHYYPLTPEHKVIFAGNPVSYGDERHLASFFQRHGNSIWFDALPPAILYEELLKKTLAGTLLEPHTTTISKTLLDVYRFLTERSTDDVLISPRELQMMALLILSHCITHAPIEPSQLPLITAHIAYTIAKPLVPQKDKGAFNHRFKPETPRTTTVIEIAAPSATLDDGFIITPSRTPVRQFLDELLALRTLRQTTTNPAIAYGGLGGLILEGEPGIGKSDLVIQTLIAHGFVEQHDLDHPTTSDKPFYRLPVSWSLAEKIKLLIKAFHEGAVVIIDEINSSPMMESLLNDLLMGLYQGRPPRQPGFLIIGTQNPTSMAGRRVQSTALSRRLTTIELQPYSTQEMVQILNAKGIPSPQATAIVKTHEKEMQRAQREQTPAPTFRDLLKLADAFLKAQALRPAPVPAPAPAPVAVAAPVPASAATAASLPPGRNQSTHTIPKPPAAQTSAFFTPSAPEAPPSKQPGDAMMTTLIHTYFGHEPKRLGGKAETYLNQRHQTYWFQDVCAQYLALVFGCFGLQSAQKERTSYLRDLHQKALDYQDNPSDTTYNALNDYITKGINDFPSRARKNQPTHQDSLKTLLTNLQQELGNPPAPAIGKSGPGSV